MTIEELMDVVKKENKNNVEEFLQLFPFSSSKITRKRKAVRKST